MGGAFSFRLETHVYIIQMHFIINSRTHLATAIRVYVSLFQSSDAYAIKALEKSQKCRRSRRRWIVPALTFHFRERNQHYRRHISFLIFVARMLE